MKRKTIGVFLAGDDDQMQGEFLLGVKQGSERLNCNIVSFHSLINRAIHDSNVKLADSVINGECSVFFGFDYSQLDAAVIMGDTFISQDIKDRIIEKANEINLPVIDVDDFDGRCYCIGYDDSSGMEIVVRHVVEDHGCRKVNFISGFKGNRQSEERIEAYKKVLADNGIPIEDSRIGYGHFYSKAKDVIKEMLEKDGLPEAVICANDTMALMVISYLSSQGCSVPEDCIVTGFDGTREGQAYHPALTSVKRAIFESGVKAVEVAMDIINGKKVEKNMSIGPVLVKNQSCGCRESDINPFDRMYYLMDDKVNKRKLFNANLIDMTRDFANDIDIWSMIDTAFNYAGFFEAPEMTFFICDEEKEQNILLNKEEQNVPDSKIYSDSFSAIKWTRGDEETRRQAVRFSNDNFLRSRFICPEDDKPFFVGLIPMYYNERIIGFLSLDETYCVSELPLLCTWIVNICSAIGNQCLKSEMELLIRKLDNMYVKDSLTNLYNRFGLHREASQLLKNAARDRHPVYALGIDLDELKKINDENGHEAGDNAILQVSNAMRYAAHNGEILSRIGGDEYFVIGYCDNEAQPEEFISRVHEFLQKYNASNKLPYKIDCSCGAYVSDPNEDDLERIMRIADINMYKVKTGKKSEKARNAEKYNKSVQEGCGSDAEV